MTRSIPIVPSAVAVALVLLYGFAQAPSAPPMPKPGPPPMMGWHVLVGCDGATEYLATAAPVWDAAANEWTFQLVGGNRTVHVGGGCCLTYAMD